MIELLIVMAIIAVLAGIMSMVIGGFQRDARMESDNNKAHMAYTGFQDALIQCEITQDKKIFDVNAYMAVPDSSCHDVTYAIVRFTMADGDISGDIYITSVYDNSSSKYKSDSYSSGTEAYENMRKAVMSFLDNSFEGTVVAYIDVENYVIDSVVYYESENYFTLNANSSGDITEVMTKTSVVGMKSYTLDSSTSASDYKLCQMLYDLQMQKTAIKNHGVYFGSYPKAIELSIAEGSGGAVT